MGELALRLIGVIQRGPIEFSALWAAIPYENDFDEMQSALAELLDAGKIEQISDTFAFRVADAASGWCPERMRDDGIAYSLSGS